MSDATLSSALELPCAYAKPKGRGTIRSVPEDFVVKEWLGFEADGEGDHWLLTIRKRGANTHWIAKQLAKLGNIHPRDVGFAGLKDRNAVAEQAFTVPGRTAIGADWLGIKGDEFDVIAAQRHRRKLKRGALKGNDFEIIVRGYTGDTADLDKRLRTIAEHGVPNYFGPQRFGRDFSNLKRAGQMFSGESRITDRLERGFALSAARSALFNAVLARRVAGGSWNRLLDGEVANLDGSNSIFAVDAIDAVLEARCATLDIHPTGPLWGRGERRVQAAARALEDDVLSDHTAFAAGLERAELEHERRALRVRVSELTGTLTDDVLTLRFRLARGAFATTVLHEVLENAFEANTPESED